MKITSRIVLLVCFTFLLSLSTSFAEEADRFQGKLGVGVMVITSGNNLNPKSSGKYLDSLSQSADKTTSIRALILPTLSYELGDSRAFKLYLSTKPPIDEAGSLGLTIGGEYTISDIGIIDLSAFFTPFQEAWENPYVTGEARETTDTIKHGIRLAFNKIMNTGLRVNMVFMKDDVDVDRIGEITPELARDGSVFAFNANYSFYISKLFEVRPRFSYKLGDYDGNSNSFSKVKIGIEARYTILEWRLTLIPRLFYSHSEFDEINPVFAETREDNGYGANILLNYSAPFGYKDWSLQGLFGVSKGDSNITFYDTEAINTGVFAVYKF